MMNRELFMELCGQEEREALLRREKETKQREAKAKYEAHRSEIEAKWQAEFAEFKRVQEAPVENRYIEVPVACTKVVRDWNEIAEAEFNDYLKIEEEYEWFLNHNIDAFVETNLVKEGDMNVHSQQKELQVA